MLTIKLQCCADSAHPCVLDAVHCHLASLGQKCAGIAHASLTHTHSLTMVPLGCLPILIQKADDAVGLHACHTATEEQRRGEEEREGELISDAWHVELG